MPKFLPRVLAALALLFAPAAHAQETRDSDPALWVVKDEDTTIYLFGTVHILRPGLQWFDEAVKQAFDASGEVMLEMVAPDAATTQALALKAAASNDGRALTARLTEEQRTAYLAALEKAKVPAAVLDPYDPWFVSVNLTMGALIGAGYDPTSGAEEVITAAAKTASKPIAGFETLEEQLGFFEVLSDAAQASMLMSTIRDLDSVPQIVGTMIEDWSKGDADAIAKLLNENLEDSPETVKVLLTDRNARWADALAKRMEKPGTVFVAVGAGHLAGAGSVQDYLAKHGLKATRVAY